MGLTKKYVHDREEDCPVCKSGKIVETFFFVRKATGNNGIIGPGFAVYERDELFSDGPYCNNKLCGLVFRRPKISESDREQIGKILSKPEALSFVVKNTHAVFPAVLYRKYIALAKSLNRGEQAYDEFLEAVCQRWELLSRVFLIEEGAQVEVIKDDEFLDYLPVVSNALSQHKKFFGDELPFLHIPREELKDFILVYVKDGEVSKMCLLKKDDIVILGDDEKTLQFKKYWPKHIIYE
jgi:hypothetical protein